MTVFHSLIQDCQPGKAEPNPAPAVVGAVRRSSQGYIEGRDSQQVLKAEAARPDATDRECSANTSPDGGPMGTGQAAAAAPSGIVRRRPNPILETPVGSSLHGVTVTQADHHIEAQILIAAQQAAIEERGGHREAALNWTQAMQQAVQARRPELVEAMDKAHAQAESEQAGWSDEAQAIGRLGA